MIVSADNKRQLVSTDLNGEAKHVHSTGEMVSDYQVSPDGQYLAFRQNYQAYVMPLMPGTQDVAADAKGGPLPVTRVSAVGAEFIHWSGGGRRLHWSIGPTRLHGRHRRLVRLRAARRERAEVPAAGDRPFAVDGGRRRPADRHRRPDRRADRHHGRPPTAGSSTTE